MNKFELLLEKLIVSEITTRDLSKLNERLNYQLRELDKNSKLEINLLKSKITDCQYELQSLAKPKTDKDE